MDKKANKKYFEISNEGGKVVLTLFEPVILDHADGYEPVPEKIKALKNIISINLELGRIKEYDTYFVALFKRLESISKQRKIEFSTSGMSAGIKNFLDVYANKEDETPSELKRSFWIDYFENIGNSVRAHFSDAVSFIEFLGELITKLLKIIYCPSQIRWKDLPYHFSNAGVNAVPIVLLILFLIGIITGYQGAMQLKEFGADIYIANLIGISITRELAPLMTAILVAGRSGSAYAAEIGTMKVSEEVDALNSMGFDHIQFLVLPRVLAVTLAMPLLTFMADLAGIVGGLITAISTLEITMTGYINQMQSALSYGDIFTGAGKSAVFGFLIATVGCFRGLQVRGGAESVGKFTTASVVTGVLLIILADAVFTFVFQSIGI